MASGSFGVGLQFLQERISVLPVQCEPEPVCNRASVSRPSFRRSIDL